MFRHCKVKILGCLFYKEQGLKVEMRLKKVDEM